MELIDNNLTSINQTTSSIYLSLAAEATATPKCLANCSCCSRRRRLLVGCLFRVWQRETRLHGSRRRRLSYLAVPVMRELNKVVWRRPPSEAQTLKARRGSRCCCYLCCLRVQVEVEKSRLTLTRSSRNWLTCKVALDEACS